MFKLLRQRFCKHKFHFITSYETDVIDGVGYDKRELFVMHCPKCSKSIEVLDFEYKKIIGIQELNDKMNNTEELD